MHSGQAMVQDRHAEAQAGRTSAQPRPSTHGLPIGLPRLGHL